MSEAVRWAAEVDEVITGDITVAVAYITPAGGAVVTAVAPCGISRPERGELGFTTSLGFGKKLERIVANPRVALAYHARDHGFSASPLFVLAQGSARVDLQPSLDRLIALRAAGDAVPGDAEARAGLGPAAARVLPGARLRGRRGRAGHGLAGPERVRRAGGRRNGVAVRPARRRSGRRRTGPGRASTSTRRPGRSPRCRTGCWPTAARTASRGRAGAAGRARRRRPAAGGGARAAAGRRPPRGPAGPFVPAAARGPEHPGADRLAGGGSGGEAVYAPHTSRGFGRRRARTCCWCPTGCWPSTGCGRPGGRARPRGWPRWRATMVR